MRDKAENKQNQRRWNNYRITGISKGVKKHVSVKTRILLNRKTVCLISSVQFLSSVRLFATPWTAACQASLSITNSRSPPKPMSTESVMPSHHLILCHPLLFLPSIFPSFRVFSIEFPLCIRWPKYWSFRFSISPYNEYSGLISFRIDWFDLAVSSTLKSLLWHHNSKASILWMVETDKKVNKPVKA